MTLNNQILGLQDGQEALSLRALVPLLYFKDNPLGEELATVFAPNNAEYTKALAKYRSENDCMRCRNTMSAFLMRMDGKTLRDAVMIAANRVLIMPRSLVGEWITIKDMHHDYKEVFKIIYEYGFSYQGVSAIPGSFPVGTRQCGLRLMFW